MIEPLPQYAKVRWLGANRGGWAGPGVGQILAFEPERLLFPDGKPATRKTNATGPAYLVKLDHNGMTVWCAAREVEAVN